MSDKATSPEHQEKPKCTLSDYDLIIMATGWVSKLCESGGTKFEMRIPVDYNHDTDMIFTEVIQRFEKANARIFSLESELKEAKKSVQLLHEDMINAEKRGQEKAESEIKALREERDKFAIDFLKWYTQVPFSEDTLNYYLEQFKAYTLNTEKN